MGWKIASALWYLFECSLSHQPGKSSGAQSRWLAARSGTDERFLRRAAHPLCFAVLSLLSGLGFGLWGLGFSAAWSALDELSKKHIEGRHCSVRDIRLNLYGTAAGAAVWLILRLFTRTKPRA
ncbi:MAG: VanZ family protein [Oscillospiraceae bacterium]|nr:VanZ family protein [Oscillospiraceae bacterium]